MDEPAAALADLTYDGEAVVDAVAVSGGAVGVTTHRVIAFTPDEADAAVRDAHRANVEAVEPASAGDGRHVVRAFRYGVYALALFGGSFLVGFDSMEAVEPSTGVAGAGRVIGMAMRLTGLLAVVDDVLRAAGVVALLAALGFLARYGLSRERHLRVEVAGDEPLRVPLRPGEPVAADRLRAALEKASNRSAG